MTANLSALMREIRYKHRITQERFGEIAGLSRGTVRNAEAGKPVNAKTEGTILDTLRLIEEKRPDEDLVSPPNSLTYTTSDGSTHYVDGEQWDPASLSPRERAVCRALLTYALGRLDESEVSDR